MADNPYDPVTTTDSTHLTDEDWGLSLSQIKYGFSRTSRFKSLCNELRRHIKILIIVSIAVFVLVLIIAIIAVAANQDSEKNETGNEGHWENPQQGLVFYPKPEKENTVIDFAPSDFLSVAPPPIIKSLNSVLNRYDMITQLNETIFSDCNITYSPANKTCRVPRHIFGEYCTEGNLGYNAGQPCIFIQLNLPDGVTIKPIQKESKLWEDAQKVISGQPDPSYVPLTCRGTDTKDTKILQDIKKFDPKRDRITYLPRNGLMSYLYRERNTNLPFLKPAVMVQFTSIISRTKVHITCIAWGQLYGSNNTMIDHKLLTTQFALFVNHE